MITDHEFRLLFRLRGIPQRNAHFMCVQGDDVKVCEALVEKGLVVDGGSAWNARNFRLNKKGRDVLLGEWLRRGQPKLKDIDPKTFDRPAPANP